MHGVRRIVLATLGRGLWTADVVRPGAGSFGSACQGHAAPPLLAVDPLATARIGQVVKLQGTGLRVGQPAAFLLVGFSNTSWNSVPLPFDMTAVGLTGCPLLVSVDLLEVAAISGSGTASWSVALPNDKALLGGKVYGQILALDPGLNPAGFGVSAGVALTLGW
jgi:hypothetical protein